MSRQREQPAQRPEGSSVPGYLWNHGGGQCGLEHRGPDKEEEKVKAEKSQGTQITEDFRATVGLLL